MSQRDKSARSGGASAPPRGKESRAKARERLAAERARQAAAEQRRARLFRAALVALVVLVVAAIGAAVIVTRKSTVATNAVSPHGATATKGYPFGAAASPVLDVYEDFQCPSCKAFEQANGKTIEALASDGKARVVYHVVAILDRLNPSGGDTSQSSTRAANAGACAQAQGRFLPFHDTIYARQPAEGVGYTNDTLKKLGQTAGVPDAPAFDACVDQHTYAGFVTQVDAEADQRQLSVTPSFFVNGKQVDTGGATSWADMGRIVVQAVNQAK